MHGVIGTLVSHAAARFGDAAAILFPGGRSLSFGEIDALSGRFAGGLAALGVGRGDRVLLQLPNSWEWIVAYHAIARMGAVVVPANDLLSFTEVAFIASDADPVIAILAPDKAMVDVGRARKVVPGGADGALAFDDVLAGRWLSPAGVGPNDLFTIGYTSGTTGKPKGAMLTQGNIFASTAMTATLWGMTEVAGPATSHSPWWPARLGSIGLPFPGTEVRIADPQGPGGDAPREGAGEIMVRGPLVMGGYWNNPAATAEALDNEGWLSTGDIGRMDEDGYLYVVDRKKDMIITGGYNIYPAELEQVIAMHPSVAMVAVAGRKDDEKGEVAEAYVVLHRDVPPDTVALIAHCRLHLAAYKIPRSLYFVDDLPKTSTGKIMRRALAPPTVKARTAAERIF